jgi:hypothetical protein
MKLMFGGRTIFFVLLDDLGFGDVFQKGGVGTFSDEFLILLSVCFVLFFYDLCLSFSDFCHEFDIMFVGAFDFLYEDFFVLVEAIKNGVLLVDAGCEVGVEWQTGSIGVDTVMKTRVFEEREERVVIVERLEKLFSLR